MNEQQVRDQLATSLKLPAISHELWDLLREDGQVQAVIDGTEGAAKDLESAARRYRRMAKAEYGPRAPHRRLAREDKEPVVPETSNRDQAQAWAISEYLAKAAEGRKHVVDFRNKILGGNKLSSSEALGFVRTKANRWLSDDNFGDVPLPFIHDPGEDDKLVEVFQFPRIGIVADVEEPDILFPITGALTLDDVKEMVETLDYRDEVGILQSVQFWPGSVLGYLSEVSYNLISEFPWEPWEASWFVLTDEIPYVPPLTVRTWGQRSGVWTGPTISLEVAPWVTGKEVMRAYHEAQQKLAGKAVTARPRQRSIEIFRFVVKQLPIRYHTRRRLIEYPDEDIRSYRQLMKKWNVACAGEHPTWKNEDPRNFARDYKQTRDHLIAQVEDADREWPELPTAEQIDAWSNRGPDSAELSGSGRNKLYL